MSDTVRIAAAQMGPADQDKGVMVERMLALLSRAGEAGVHVLCFPELALTPYFPAQLYEDIRPFFEDEFPPAVAEPLLRLARELAVAIILPYAERDEDRYYNSAAILGPQGEVLGKYRKMHLPGWVEPKPEGFNCLEKRYFTPGDLGFPVFDTPRARIGVQICYDRRFPESARGLALNGAQIIFTPYVTPVPVKRPSEINPSELCLRASAHSNNCFVVGAGKAGVENGTRMIGNSIVVEPRTGNVVARASTDGDELVWAEVDLAQLKDIEKLDLMGDRRPEWYGAVAGATAKERA
ncbi:MAG: nitrilase-related carbon-nitrogen hydrolase [Dehalococcoidia bacterium]